MSNKPRITFLIPFLGSWPRYINLFLAGCSANTMARFLLCAECPPAADLPDNVLHIPMSSAEILERIRKGTGLELAAIPGHKLCDFRPFFSTAFEDLLKNSEFWGYCDIDLIFGRMNQAIDRALLESVDAFSAHPNQFVGHLTFVRNLPDINRLAFEIPRWQELCLSPVAEHVDEERFSDVLKNHPRIRWWRPESLERELQKDFCRHSVTFSFKGRIADMRPPSDVMVTWDQGRLWMERPAHRKTEILYVHFMGIKHPWHWPRDGFSSTGPHVFSKLGYGRIHSMEELKTWRARLLYGWQTALFQTKIVCGRVLKKTFPPKMIRGLRRKFGI